MNDDHTVKLKHEELTFDQVRLWRFLLASDLIDEATAPCLNGGWVSKVPGFAIGSASLPVWPSKIMYREVPWGYTCEKFPKTSSAYGAKAPGPAISKNRNCLRFKRRVHIETTRSTLPG